MEQVSSKWLKAGILGLAASMSMTAHSAGFFNNESSVSGMALSFAGVASNPQDASANWSNPASMVLLGERQLTMGFSGVLGNAEFDLTSATDPFGADLLLGNPGSLNDDLSVPALVPATHIVYPVSEDLVFGASLTIPFGLATEYEQDSVFRYLATFSELLTINLNPNVAYRLTDNFSVGAGVNIQYARVELQKQGNAAATCFGLAGLGVVNGADCVATFGAPDGQNTSSFAFDFENDFTADDVSWGWNIGLLWEITDHTRLGATYRSKFSHNLDGKAEFDGAGLDALNGVNTIANGLGVPDGIPAGVGAGFITQGITADADLPEYTVVSLYHQLTDSVELLADVSFIRWSRFQKIAIAFESLLAATPPTNKLTNRQDYHDSWRASLGMQYHYDDNWILRFGYMYDQSPIREDHRTVRLPGTDRHWASFGVMYRIADAFDVSFGYAHIFFDQDGDVSEEDALNAQGDPVTQATLVGKYALEADLVGLELNWRF